MKKKAVGQTNGLTLLDGLLRRVGIRLLAEARSLPCLSRVCGGAELVVSLEPVYKRSLPRPTSLPYFELQSGPEGCHLTPPAKIFSAILQGCPSTGAGA